MSIKIHIEAEAKGHFSEDIYLEDMDIAEEDWLLLSDGDKKRHVAEWLNDDFDKAPEWEVDELEEITETEENG